MLNRILWTLDNEIHGDTFERLCIDLLYRTGYKDIVPIEPQDGGRDAEEFPRTGRGRANEPTFFQFSIEKGWKSKLRRDSQKLFRGGYKFSTLVFVTTQRARGVDVDSLRKEYRHKYQWELFVYSREWLRHQLEEAHPDLAKKYLDVDLSNASAHLSAIVALKKPPEERLSTAWNAFNVGAYARAAVEFRDYLEDHPESAEVHQMLAWCQYQAYHYDEALATINHAIDLEKDDQSLSIRACILAEKGISENQRALLLQARRLFEHLRDSSETPSWMTYYNLGNVLSALSDHKDAIQHYKRALELEHNEPMIWKNLGSVYHLTGEHELEMKCFDQVLEIDPMKPEALVSKGVSLLIDFGNSKEAVALLEQALKANRDWAIHWPFVWYWLGMAYLQEGRPEQGLKWVNEGLAHQPGQAALKKLKSHLLVKILPENPRVTEEARMFWRTELASEPYDLDARMHLIRIEAEYGENASAWDLIEEAFVLMDVRPVVPLRRAKFSIDECITALIFLPQYRLFREKYPISDYWQQEDPLYDLPFPPPPTWQVDAALTTYLSISFSAGFHFLAMADSLEKATIREFFEFIRPRIELALAEAARYFASHIPPKSSGVENMSAKLTEALLFLGLISLREFGRQRGWLAGQYQVPSSVMDNALSDYDEAQIEANVITSSLITLNDEIDFVPSTESSESSV